MQSNIKQISQDKDIYDKYDVKYAGKTFEIRPYEHFSGAIITPKNWRQVTKSKYIEFVNDLLSSNEDFDEESLTEEMKTDCMTKANNYVRMNKKAFKSYLKGDIFFKYKGEKYRVPTKETIELFKDRLKEFEDKYKTLPGEEE